MNETTEPRKRTIRQTMPVQGDWFGVAVEHDSTNGPTWTIARIVVWALVEKEGLVDYVDGIDLSGLPFQDGFCGFTDTFLVSGLDKAHNGSTWLEIYARSIPNISQWRDITSEFSQTDAQGQL